MQNQAPGYKPAKSKPGIKKGSKQVRGGNAKKNVRKTSAYSKNRTGIKTTKMPQSYKGMMMNQPLSRVPVQSNNMPGFNAPIGPSSILL